MAFTQHTVIWKTRQGSKEREEEKTKKALRIIQDKQSDPLRCDKGKHGEWPKYRLPQINILLLFVWEKCARSPWELYLSQELEAHAVLRRRPNNCTLVEGAPTKAPPAGITISDTCRASESPPV